MSVTNITEKKSVSNGQKRNTNLVRLILEGRAFFALIVDHRGLLVPVALLLHARATS